MVVNQSIKSIEQYTHNQCVNRSSMGAHVRERTQLTRAIIQQLWIIRKWLIR